MRCAICEGNIDVHRNDEGKVIWTEGHNAEPVVENGRCCDYCNTHVVIPVRIVGVMTNAKTAKLIELAKQRAKIA